MKNKHLHLARRKMSHVEEFWELAGGDQYTSESELALVGQIIDQAAVTVEETRVEMDLFISY